MQTHEYYELIQEIDWIKEHLLHLEDRMEGVEKTKKLKRPTIEAIGLYAAKIGLPPEEAENFFNHYNSNGWKVGKVPMRSWESAMINWRKNYQAGVYRGNGHDPKSLNVVLQAKETLARKLCNEHCVEDAMGRKWTDEGARQRFVVLKKEIRELTTRIAQSA